MKNKLLITLLALMGILIPTKGQVVNYGDSNYMFIHYTPTPPISTLGTSAIGFGTILARSEVIENGTVFAVDSVEHIYGIAFTADTIIHGKNGYRRDQSIPVGLYLYNVPRGSDEPILLDSIIVYCSLPYKKFVFHSYDTLYSPHVYLHDTVPVYERLFSREHVFGPNDSVFVSFGFLPTPNIQGLGYEDHEFWNCIFHVIWPGDQQYGRHIDNNGRYTYRASNHPGPVFPIRHRACPKVEGLRVDSTDGTRVWISWPPVASATHYRLEYGPSGFKYGCGVYSEGRVVEVDSITGTSYCITSARPDTLYTYFVSAYCSTMKQYGMPDSVRIAANDVMRCPMTEGLRIDSLLPHGVRLAWDTVPGQMDFQLYVRRDDTAALYLRPTSNPYDLTGLADSILYTVMLRAQCQHLCPLHDTLLWGRWGHPVQFTLESPDSSDVGVREANEVLRVTVVPNPAHGTVTVVTEGLAMTNATITVTDVAGRTVASVPLVADRQQVDIAALPAGLYFVTIATPKGSSSTKLAVE